MITNLKICKCVVLHLKMVDEPICGRPVKISLFDYFKNDRRIINVKINKSKQPSFKLLMYGIIIKKSNNDFFGGNLDAHTVDS